MRSCRCSNLYPAGSKNPSGQFGATSSTLIATTSQPRNLLSMAKLNNARSRVRLSIWSLVRIAQTCFCRSGGLAPVSFPLFQGIRLGADSSELALSCMVALLGYRGDQLALARSGVGFCSLLD